MSPTERSEGTRVLSSGLGRELAPLSTEDASPVMAAILLYPSLSALARAQDIRFKWSNGGNIRKLTEFDSTELDS